MMEFVDCFDALNHPTHQTYARSDLKGSPCYFRVVHLWWIVQEKWLVQKRGKADDLRPYMWAFTTGLVTTGETPENTIIRETQEELGVILKPSEITLKKIVPTHTGPYKTFAYIYETHRAPEPFTLSEEVLATDWWSLSAIQGKIKVQSFWDYPTLLDAPDYFLSKVNPDES